MGIRFSKSIKIGNLLKVNLSKSGVSVSAGLKGASINLGKNGTYLNLSPSLVGVKSTGLSYRQKIAGGYGTVAKKVLNKDTSKTKQSKLNKNDNELVEETNNKVSPQNNETNTNIDTSSIDDYNKAIEAQINLHKYTDDVLSKADFDAHLNELENEASKTVYQLLIDGDEDTIESSVGAFLNNLDLDYEVKCNYELEDHVLYVDLDLPEIENFADEYPCLVKGKLVNKKKSVATLKEEYGKTVLSLGVFLVSNFFNLSSYIDEIVISAFTTKRNTDGDLADEYLYSIKYLREKFIGVKLEELDDVYKFVLNFENRINMSATYSFKAIKPYESTTVQKEKSILDDAIDGLKELGYKASDIQKILPKLSELKFDSAGEYIKEALKLLSNQ